MAFQLAEGYVQISQRGFRGVGSAIAGIKNRLLSLINPANAVAAALAAIGTGLGVAKTLKAFGVQADAEKQLEQVVRATGAAAGFTAGELKKMAAELQTVTKHGDEVTMGAQSMLLTFKSIKGDAFERTLETAMDLSAVFNQDLKSSVVQLGKALEDPERGMSALRRVGVSFTEQQEEVIKKLAATGKLAEAQAMMLDQIAGQVGGSARAMAETPIGAWTQAKNAIGDILEDIGGMIFETFNLGGVIKNIKTFAEGFTASFGNAVRDALHTVKNLAIGVFQVASNTIKAILQLFGVNVDNMGKSISEFSGNAVRWIADFAVNASEWFRAFADNFDKILRNLGGVFKVALSYMGDLWYNFYMNFLPQAVGYGLRKAFDFFLWFSEKVIRLTWTIIEIVVDAMAKLPSMIMEALRTGASLASVFAAEVAAAVNDAMAHAVAGLEGKMPSLQEVFTPSERTKRLMEKELGGVFADVRKRKDELERQREGRKETQAEAAARGAKGGGEGGAAAVPAIQAPSAPVGKFSFSGLVDKMQTAAFTAMEKKDGAAERGAKAMEDLNKAAQGEGVAVRLIKAGQQAMESMPAWG